tara:strand:+ start:33720 stop:34520 length:801 start_codon:yes stop_codon:yes gene_type:complete
MKKIQFFSLILFSVLFISCSGTKQVTVVQKNQALPVDGSLVGWTSDNTLISSSDDINYYAYLHDNILYLFVDVKDPRLDSAIRQSGLIVYLSNSEENRKRVGIGYPVGSFNLLRESPATYNDFTTDPEFARKPENVELMRSLLNQIYSKVMIVERYDGQSNAEYGFVEKHLVEIDGIEIASDQERRLITLEMKIPLDGSTLYNVEKGSIWVGFALEPPIFRFPNTDTMMNDQQSRGYYGQRNRTAQRMRSQPRMLSRDDWYLLRFD